MFLVVKVCLMFWSIFETVISCYILLKLKLEMWDKIYHMKNRKNRAATYFILPSSSFDIYIFLEVKNVSQ